MMCQERDKSEYRSMVERQQHCWHCEQLVHTESSASSAPSSTDFDFAENVDCDCRDSWIFQRSCSIKRGDLISGMELKRATETASYSSLFYSSQPMTAALTRTPFRIFFAFISSIMTYYFQSDFVFIQHDGARLGSKFKFTALELRNRMCPASSNVLSIGLLLNDRIVPLPQHSLRSHGPSIEISLPSGATWNGWYFNTSMEDLSFDPVRFSFEAFDSQSQTWTTVGSSTYLSIASTNTFFHGRYATTRNRGELEIQSRRPRFPQKMQLVTNLMVAVFTGLTGLSGSVGLERCGRTLLSFVVMWCALSDAAIAIWLLMCNSTSEVCEKGSWTHLFAMSSALQYSLAFLFLGVLKKEHVQLFFVTIGSFTFGSALVLLHYPNDGPYSSTSWFFLISIPCLSIALWVLINRRIIVARAKQLVEKDKDRYSELWTQITESQQEALIDLERLVRDFQPICTKDAVQYQPPSHVCSLMPESCLDRLYAGSIAVDPLLREKTLLWASKAGGLLPCVVCSECPKYLRLMSTDGSEVTCVRWASLKRRERAIEKIVRIYSSDVSKIMDIVRQSIIFDSVLDLSTCLRVIFEDEDVEIVRVKNRLDRRYDASATAGYRDVLLNLRFLSAKWYVCELQLILRDFAELKTDSGHSRYVSWRNALCA
uniref:Uncharacterized protein n=1 Tax=Hanusia phi TaxID=3032 RepID=A0A7S0HFA5_9CRYP|mmetsp:Transcript_16323/g.37266  ORF Transcript_16323/g.37266 Transcript_16323/m.37266 type:complete len:655 (+) Transcript_16323:60-2024(+)